ncbi:aspartate/glutamate racemase family protein [Actinokineospora pegani]|uniref:aspartate/glutamate racemase family protein n=1 Tax=Actinokineospora pegani TaxID=2654637 RepID=UPI0012EADDE5|nr:aspartate/glutamate racemase family protein [Actinokineospora pegani]
MKVIGLLGGMSWESSAEYYRIVNERVKLLLGGYHSARVVLYSVDFAEVERMQAEDRWDDAARLLRAGADALRRAGADIIVLCTNTMHKVADSLGPILHLGDATAAAVEAAGVRTVGLLGTAFTMEQDFYRGRLESHGLTVLTPSAEDRAEVHRVIYDELVLGRVLERSRQVYREVIARLVERGAQGVVLGCTEIELLVSQEDSPVPVFPTTRLHAELAVDLALRGSGPPGPAR